MTVRRRSLARRNIGPVFCREQADLPSGRACPPGGAGRSLLIPAQVSTRVDTPGPQPAGSRPSATRRSPSCTRLAITLKFPSRGTWSHPWPHSPHAGRRRRRGTPAAVVDTADRLAHARSGKKHPPVTGHRRPPTAVVPGGGNVARPCQSPSRGNGPVQVGAFPWDASRAARPGRAAASRKVVSASARSIPSHDPSAQTGRPFPRLLSRRPAAADPRPPPTRGPRRPAPSPYGSLSGGNGPSGSVMAWSGPGALSRPTTSHPRLGWAR
jgi:hypothetical protein